MQRIKNVEDLRNELLSVFENIQATKEGVNLANAKVNTAKAIMQTCKAQVDYARITGKQANIDFLRVDK